MCFRAYRPIISTANSLVHSREDELVSTFEADKEFYGALRLCSFLKSMEII